MTATEPAASSPAPRSAQAPVGARGGHLGWEDDPAVAPQLGTAVGGERADGHFADASRVGAGAAGAGAASGTWAAFGAGGASISDDYASGACAAPEASSQWVVPTSAPTPQTLGVDVADPARVIVSYLQGATIST